MQLYSDAELFRCSFTQMQINKRGNVENVVCPFCERTEVSIHILLVTVENRVKNRDKETLDINEFMAFEKIVE
jgi:hypothetical protein